MIMVALFIKQKECECFETYCLQSHQAFIQYFVVEATPAYASTFLPLVAESHGGWGEMAVASGHGGADGQVPGPPDRPEGGGRDEANLVSPGCHPPESQWPDTILPCPTALHHGLVKYPLKYRVTSTTCQVTCTYSPVL